MLRLAPPTNLSFDISGGSGRYNPYRKLPSRHLLRWQGSGRLPKTRKIRYFGDQFILAWGIARPVAGDGVAEYTKALRLPIVGPAIFVLSAVYAFKIHAGIDRPEVTTMEQSQVHWDMANTLEQLGGDLALLQEVLVIFLNEAPQHLAALGLAVEQGNAEKVEAMAHTMKGELGYLGVPEISRMARELEEMGAFPGCRACRRPFLTLRRGLFLACFRSVRTSGAMSPAALAAASASGSASASASASATVRSS